MWQEITFARILQRNQRSEQFRSLILDCNTHLVQQLAQNTHQETQRFIQLHSERTLLSETSA